MQTYFDWQIKTQFNTDIKNILYIYGWKFIHLKNTYT